MPLDTRIPLSFQPPQIESPLAQYGQMVQLYNAMQQQKTAQLQHQLAERKVREQDTFRQRIAALGPDATPEQRAAVAAEFAGPEALITDAQRRNTADSNKQLALARLAQAQAISDRNFDVALRNATSREEANRLTALKAQNDQTLAQQKHFWETGQFLNVPAIPIPQVQPGPTQNTQPQPQAIAPQAAAPPSAEPMQAGYTSPGVPPITVKGDTEQQATAMFNAARQAAGIKTLGPVAQTGALSPKAQQEVDVHGRTKTQDAVIKGLGENYDRLKDAPQQLANIEKAKALIPSAKLFVGSLGEQKLAVAKFFNNNLGLSINLEGVSSAEELRSRIFFNVMDNLKKMDAQPSQLQQQIMQDALGKLGSDPNALPRILDAFGDAIRDKVAIYGGQVKDATDAGINWPLKISVPERPKQEQAQPAQKQGVREFATLKDALAAGVKPGEKVRIGGVVGTIQK